ncbi:MAG: recombinase family protein [Clostridium sp.]
MKIAIYSRKSIFTGKGESIENQIEMCKDYFSRYNNTHVEYLIYEDEGFSGGNTNRPEFQRLLNDAKDKKFKSLVCYRLDRISRNVADFSQTLELLQNNNIDFISIREQFDTSTPMGRAMVYIASVFAQLERETIAERVRDNMIELSKTGRWLGGTPPLGFSSIKETLIDENFKERTLSKLIIEENELTKVKLIYDKYLATESLSQVAKFTYECNITGKLGGDIDKSTISNVLQNPVYVKSTPNVLEYLRKKGFSVYGEANGNGLMRYAQNDDDKIVAVSLHPGIIEGDTWIKVQELIERNKFKPPTLGKTNLALLTGLLKCGKCGANMIVKYGSVYKNNKQAFYYKCSNKSRSYGIKCDSHNINGYDAENLVIDTVYFYNRNNLLKEVDRLISTSKKFSSTKSKEIEYEITLIEDKIKRLLNKLSLTDDLDISTLIMSQLKENKIKLNELKASLDKDMTEEVNGAITRREIESILDKLRNFNPMFSYSSIDEKRRLLNDVIDYISWNEDSQELQVFYKSSLEK